LYAFPSSSSCTERKRKIMLRHLFFSAKKIEPESILYTRRIFIVFSLILLIGFFVILCIKMVKEQPTISTALISTNNLLAPGKRWFFLVKEYQWCMYCTVFSNTKTVNTVIYLGFRFDFTVSCLLYYNYNGSKKNFSY